MIKYTIGGITIVVEIEQGWQSDEDTFHIRLDVNGEKRQHTLTVAAPVRVIQAGADMNCYPQKVHMAVYRYIKRLLRFQIKTLCLTGCAPGLNAEEHTRFFKRNFPFRLADCRRITADVLAGKERNIATRGIKAEGQATALRDLGVNVTIISNFYPADTAE